MTYEYYRDALTYIQNQDNSTINVLYFCEEEDIDDVLVTIDKLKGHFPDFIFERAPNSLCDWQQLLLMSCCKNNIIANSSFSWWAAWFNTNMNKCVCYPKVWFGPNVQHDTRDLCPPEWTAI
jgi:hypothetical protein